MLCLGQGAGLAKGRAALCWPGGIKGHPSLQGGEGPGGGAFPHRPREPLKGSGPAGERRLLFSLGEQVGVGEDAVLESRGSLAPRRAGSESSLRGEVTGRAKCHRHQGPLRVFHSPGEHGSQGKWCWEPEASPGVRSPGARGPALRRCLPIRKDPASPIGEASGCAPRDPASGRWGGGLAGELGTLRGHAQPHQRRRYS